MVDQPATNQPSTLESSSASRYTIDPIRARFAFYSLMAMRVATSSLVLAFVLLTFRCGALPGQGIRPQHSGQ